MMESINNKTPEKKSNFFLDQPVGIVLTVGIILGWIFSFILICFIAGGSIEELMTMEEVAFRIILFISFPMGAILGMTFVLVYRKVAQEKKAPKQTIATTIQKDMVTKLKELKELLDSGVLSQEEFDSQKEKLLAES